VYDSEASLAVVRDEDFLVAYEKTWRPPVRFYIDMHTVRPRYTADCNTAGRALPLFFFFSGDTGCQNTDVSVSGIPPVAQYRRFSRAAQGGGISCTHIQQVFTQQYLHVFIHAA
jgi:hypothetical protein